MDTKKTLGHVLKNQAKSRGSKRYLHFKDDIYTYSQIDKASSRIAAALSKSGIKKGDRVCGLLGNSPEFFMAIYGVAKAGAVFVPINIFLKQEEIEYIVKDCEAKLMITDNEFEKNLVDIEINCKELDQVFCMGESDEGRSDLLKYSADMDDSFIYDNINEEDLAILIYSSGTTGHPKGAMLTHSNLISNALSACEAFEIKKKYKFLHFLPSFHSFAMMVSIILPTVVGCQVIILEGVSELKKKSFKKILIKKRPSVFLAVPQVYQALSKANMPWFFRKFLYPFKLHISGGAPLPEDVLKAFNAKYPKPVIEGYGLSEASPAVAVNRLDKQKPMSVGMALPGVDVKVVDDNEVEVPVGEAGELIVKGPNVMKGYWNMPGLTDETLRNGWLFTGDIAKIDEDGFIYIVDRKKDLILVKGINVYPREIEEVLHNHEKVEAAAVIGMKDEQSGERPVAYVIKKDDVELSEKELKKYLREHLANYKLPRDIIFRSEMPMTATGKILKRELKAEVLGK